MKVLTTPEFVEITSTKIKNYVMMLIAGNIRQICQFETNFFLKIGNSESQANVDCKDAVCDVDSLVYLNDSSLCSFSSNMEL